MDAISIVEIFTSRAKKFPEAVCAQTDPELFFPEKGGSTRSAKKLCHSCVHKIPCLQDALDNDERYGIWGGLSEQERRKLQDPSPRMSPREQQIFRLHEQGFTTRQIADRLNLSVQSVWQYQKNAQRKAAA